MTSPTGIIPEALMSPGHKGEVIEFVKKMPVPGDDKERLLIAWAQAVGAHISGSQRRAVRFSGTDY